MKRILSLFILSLLMVGARAASPFVDFSKYRNLEGVRYVYLPGSMARQGQLTSDMAGFTPTTFSEVDGILMLLPLKNEITTSLLEHRKDQTLSDSLRDHTRHAEHDAAAAPDERLDGHVRRNDFLQQREQESAHPTHRKTAPQ